VEHEWFYIGRIHAAGPVAVGLLKCIRASRRPARGAPIIEGAVRCALGPAVDIV
jgi:hypothetical protein